MRTRAELLRALERDGIAFILRESGDAWMVVAPGLGARILGAGIGQENLLWTAQQFSARGWRDGGNAGGSRTWIAPEGGPRGFFFSAAAACYEVPRALDPGDYRPSPAEEGWLAFRNLLTARSADGRSYPVAITRSMRIEELDGTGTANRPAGARIRVHHEIENTGPAAIDGRIALWCVVQVPSESPGTIIIPLRAGTAAGSVHPYFVDPPPGVVRVSGSAILVKALGGRKYKIGVAAQAAAGGICFVRPSRRSMDWTLVSLSFAVQPSGLYLDRSSHGPDGEASSGDAVQAYNDAGTGDLAFSEIEAHAPAATLGPGERQGFACDLAIAAQPKRAVLEMARREMATGVSAKDLFDD